MLFYCLFKFENLEFIFVVSKLSCFQISLEGSHFLQKGRTIRMNGFFTFQLIHLFVSYLDLTSQLTDCSP